MIPKCPKLENGGCCVAPLVQGVLLYSFVDGELVQAIPNKDPVL